MNMHQHVNNQNLTYDYYVLDLQNMCTYYYVKKPPQKCGKKMIKKNPERSLHAPSRRKRNHIYCIYNILTCTGDTDWANLHSYFIYNYM